MKNQLTGSVFLENDSCEEWNKQKQYSFQHAFHIYIKLIQGKMCAIGNNSAKICAGSVILLEIIEMTDLTIE